jgi:hypothetical protein
MRASIYLQHEDATSYIDNGFRRFTIMNQTWVMRRHKSTEAQFESITNSLKILVSLWIENKSREKWMDFTTSRRVFRAGEG